MPSGLDCQWQHAAVRPCHGRVEEYNLISDEDKIAQTRTLCKRHMQEKKKDLDDGWRLVRRQDSTERPR